MDKRRLGSGFVVVGAVLLVAALLLFFYNQREAASAGEAADAALAVLQDSMGENTPPMLVLEEEEETQPEETIEETIPEPTALTVVDVDGNGYIGYLSIPSYELELPIMADWSMEKLQIAPCLQYGSPLTDDAVIAGHNYKQHFLALHTIEPGETVTFTDMTGYVIEYQVVERRKINPTDVYEVIDSEYDLVMYTCTTGGGMRVIACCNRVEHIPEPTE